jgi:anti-sigma factor RsiW
MSTPTFHDIEQLSAFLDGQLNQVQKTRLEARLHADPAMAEALEELRQVRTMLHRTPHRHAPRNFTLTPKMAGIRAPVPRLVPALSWASAVATLLFIFTLGSSLLGNLTLGAAAPKAADLYGLGSGPASAAATSAPATAAPATAAPAFAPPATQLPVATQALGNGTEIPTASVEVSNVPVPEATTQAVARVIAPPATSSHQPKQNVPWLYIWLVLAILLVSAAMLTRWLNQRAFARRIRH